MDAVGKVGRAVCHICGGILVFKVRCWDAVCRDLVAVRDACGGSSVLICDGYCGGIVNLRHSCDGGKSVLSVLSVLSVFAISSILSVRNGSRCCSILVGYCDGGGRTALGHFGRRGIAVLSVCTISAGNTLDSLDALDALLTLNALNPLFASRQAKIQDRVRISACHRGGGIFACRKGFYCAYGDVRHRAQFLFRFAVQKDVGGTHLCIHRDVINRHIRIDYDRIRYAHSSTSLIWFSSMLMALGLVAPLCPVLYVQFNCTLAEPGLSSKVSACER